jgi:hypothetical protein
MTPTDSAVQAMLEGRRADTGRRRGRVLAALAEAAKDGSEVSVAVIARPAGVDRTLLQAGNRDLLGQIHAQAAEPLPIPDGPGPAASRASLRADLTAGDARTRPPGRTHPACRSPPSARSCASTSGASSGSVVAAMTLNSFRPGSPPADSRSSTWSSCSKTVTTTSPPSAPPTAS